MNHLHRLAADAWDFCAEVQEFTDDDTVLTNAFCLARSLSRLACWNEHRELLKAAHSDAPFQLGVPNRHRELAGKEGE